MEKGKERRVNVYSESSLYRHSIWWSEYLEVVAKFENENYIERGLKSVCGFCYSLKLLNTLTYWLDRLATRIFNSHSNQTNTYINLLSGIRGIWGIPNKFLCFQEEDFHICSWKFPDILIKTHKLFILQIPENRAESFTLTNFNIFSVF